jgi:aspartate aminotransferase-like enzyme
MIRMKKVEASLRFKIANEEWEFEAVHRLNYKTFVEEIPQHARNPQQRLVDKFHAENTYAICLHGERLVGMVTGRAQRPFSLDKKLNDPLETHLPPGHRILEVRLLSVEKEHRNGFVFSRLVGLLAQHFKDLGYDLAIISGTVRQQRLYKHLGFVPFGPLVGAGDAQFQPMYLTLEKFLQMAEALSPPSDTVERILASYLPGPVDVPEDVRRAFGREPVSHRSEGFMADFRATRRMLCALTRAQHVEILLGSGSLANDTVCAQLALLNEPGLILSNGEFGDRLIDHATRQGLDFEVYTTDWGEPFNDAELRRRLITSPHLRWMWAAHCETSTGILNDVNLLQEICAAGELKLCLDCISSIGTVPVDLSAVYLATCVSGKALASYPGLSMVFYNHALTSAPKRLPRYLDLGYYASQAGVPFTHSSNLVYALQTALTRTDWNEKFGQIAAIAVWLRQRLRELGMLLVASDAHASPAVATLALPPDINSARLGLQLRQAGYLLSYNSSYLLERNWIQICLMGEWSKDPLILLPDLIADLLQRQRSRGNATSAVAG